MKFTMKLIFSFLFVGTLTFSQQLTLEQANHLATLPIKCLQQEYPNKLNQLLLNNTELLSPKELHPAFYGCFDWHSSVHGHLPSDHIRKKYDLFGKNSGIQYNSGFRMATRSRLTPTFFFAQLASLRAPLRNL